MTWRRPSMRKPCWFCGTDDPKQIRGACHVHYRQFTREAFRAWRIPGSLRHIAAFDEKMRRNRA